MSEHIIDGKVIPFDGGRKSRDTRTWRDATDLEIQQAERIAELEAALDSRPAIDLSKLQRYDPASKDDFTRYMERDDTGDYVSYDDVAALIEGDKK